MQAGKRDCYIHSRLFQELILCLYLIPHRWRLGLSLVLFKPHSRSHKSDWYPPGMLRSTRIRTSSFYGTRKMTRCLSLLLVAASLHLPVTSAKTTLSVHGKQNCTETDSRLPKYLDCGTPNFCISINRGLNAYCCPDDRACMQFPQVSCDPNVSPWTDRVRTWSADNPRKGCGNGVCCPVGYDCINGPTREASNCVLLRADAIYPAGIDPDDPQRCINECKYHRGTMQLS
jgi:hypothetical protein